MSSKSGDTPAFTLHNTSDDFTKKSDSLFGCLKTLEDKHVAFEKARAGSSSPSDNTGLHKNDPSEEETETITPAFKKPANILNPAHGRQGSHSLHNKDRRSPLENREQRSWQRGNNRFVRGKRTRVPDFRDRPQKWTKYSLADVDDMSESSNKGAAFAFLEERRKLREEQEKTEVDDIDVRESACSKGLFTFKRPDKSSEKGRQPGSQTSDGDIDHDSKSFSKTEISNYDDFSEEFKDSGVEDNPDNDSVIQDTKTSSDKSTVSVFKSSKNRKQRNIRKKDNSDEEDE